ncbi:MAG: type II toxin-antitoxin system RelE/ParE family toxin [Oscillospiraceae bacterium]|jgi:plasmid stabilization system protein ParE|nr:type II toxin-antitoxin system RelE/ParE family toxin [Oscillospiraceae bacterium]
MYDVIYLPFAEEELNEAVRYITVQFSAPDAALALVDAVEEAVSKLAYMPYRHPVYHATDDLEAEIRLLVVKNYNIYYAVSVERKTVEIRRVTYGRRIAF